MQVSNTFTINVIRVPQRQKFWRPKNISCIRNDPKQCPNTWQIGHFRVLVRLCFKTGLSAKMSSATACSFFLVQIKVISIRMVLHLDSLWLALSRYWRFMYRYRERRDCLKCAMLRVTPRTSGSNIWSIPRIVSLGRLWYQLHRTHIILVGFY